jgi:apolipoprotein N-acyltransferase
LLLWIAWPPTPYTTFFLFVGLVPMLLAMENIIQSTLPKKGKRYLTLPFWGFLSGIRFVFTGFITLKNNWPCCSCSLTLYLMRWGHLLMATACWLYYRLRLITNRPISLVALVCFWIGYEYLHQSWDLNFPWMTLGNGFAVSHQWIQWYEYTGVYGGTIWIWAINILLFLIYVGCAKHKPNNYASRLIAFTL